MKEYSLFLLSVFISSVSQIMLKKSTGILYKSWWMEYINLYVIVAYVIFILSTFLTMYAYRGVPLSLGPILEATSYIYVSIMSFIFLKEEIKRKKIIGLIFIIIGILISTK